MSKINLLPWREEMRKGLNKLFFLTLGGAVFLSAAIVVLFEMYFNYRTEVENANIAYINNEMKSVVMEVAEVKNLQENKKQLIERMNIVRSLESDRTSIVRLLDMIPHVLPESIYLTGLSRTEVIPEQMSGNNMGGLPSTANKGSEKNKVEPATTTFVQQSYLVTMEGVATTNGGISVLLKNLEAINWLSSVNLNEVSINKDGEGLDFKLGFIQDLSEKE
jgi:Tfp pilus assembly protein PilN